MASWSQFYEPDAHPDYPMSDRPACVRIVGVGTSTTEGSMEYRTAITYKEKQSNYTVSPNGHSCCKRLVIQQGKQKCDNSTNKADKSNQIRCLRRNQMNGLLNDIIGIYTSQRGKNSIKNLFIGVSK